ncbi:RAB3C [Mytilus coruscus]|uniref:RAB3C n=1 Tax=Mytilus coruscus TaxID=42192 RepID=A0A6J8DXT3_MYTCO|nr:RAB3C [Mytilus coruscus]
MNEGIDPRNNHAINNEISKNVKIESKPCDLNHSEVQTVKASTGKSKKNAMQNNPSYHVKVVITGDLNVGKTSLIRALVGPEHDSVLRGQRTGRVKTEFRRTDNNIKMDIWDTAGQERYRSLTASYYRGAHGCLIMFDLTKHHTFENVTSWLTDLRQYTTNPEKISTILVGTRCHAKRREVSKEKAEAFAEHVGLPYIEVSSEEDINVREVFDLLSDNILQTLKRHPSLLMVPATSTKLSDNDTKKKMYWCSC